MDASIPPIFAMGDDCTPNCPASVSNSAKKWCMIFGIPLGCLVIFLVVDKCFWNIVAPIDRLEVRYRTRFDWRRGRKTRYTGWERWDHRTRNWAWEWWDEETLGRRMYGAGWEGWREREVRRAERAKGRKSWWRFDGKRKWFAHKYFAWMTRHTHSSSSTEVDVEKGLKVPRKAGERGGSIGSEETLIQRPTLTVRIRRLGMLASAFLRPFKRKAEVDEKPIPRPSSSPSTIVNDDNDNDEEKASIKTTTTSPPTLAAFDEITPIRPIIPAHLPYPQWHSLNKDYPKQGIPERDCWVCYLSDSQREGLPRTLRPVEDRVGEMQLVHLRVDRPFHDDHEHLDDDSIRRFHEWFGTPLPPGWR